MTFLGELLGYNSRGNDILGSNRDPRQNCPACGICVMDHNLSMEAECAHKLFTGVIRETEEK